VARQRHEQVRDELLLAARRHVLHSHEHAHD
jgi:hypothetical protein